MRLPRDPDNWTGWHAEKALAIARREFERYEARINFEWPQEKQDACYWPYSLAKRQAEEVCGTVGEPWAREAKTLP